MYSVNEIFLAPQGEGYNVGRMMVFVRFAGCNLACNGEVVGGVLQPVCDTNFSGGRRMTANEIADEVASHGVEWVVFTGGEPMLQLDLTLINAVRVKHDKYVAIETNGTRQIPFDVDYVAVSPKTAEHALALDAADEVRYCIANGQALPRPSINAAHYFLSPTWESDGTLRLSNVHWAIKLCKENPRWRLSVQTHKLLGLR